MDARRASKRAVGRETQKVDKFDQDYQRFLRLSTALNPSLVSARALKRESDYYTKYVCLND